MLKGYVHIGIAVDTEHGLMVPVIRNADTKGLWQIAAEIADLARRAQTRKIGPDDMGGGSMTITNLGGIGGTAFTPIVNPPCRRLSFVRRRCCHGDKCDGVGKHDGSWWRIGFRGGARYCETTSEALSETEW